MQTFGKKNKTELQERNASAGSSGLAALSIGCRRGEQARGGAPGRTRTWAARGGGARAGGPRPYAPLPGFAVSLTTRRPATAAGTSRWACELSRASKDLAQLGLASAGETRLRTRRDYEKMVGKKRKKPKRGDSRAVTLSPLHAVWAPAQGHRSPGARDGGEAAGEGGKAQENFARRQGQPAPGRPAVPSAEVPKPEGAECATEVVTRTLLGRFHFVSSLLYHLRDKVHLLRHQFLSRTYFAIGERNRPGESLPRPDAHLPGPLGSRLGPTGQLSLGFEVVLVSQFWRSFWQVSLAAMTRSKLWKIADKNSQLPLFLF